MKAKPAPIRVTTALATLERKSEQDDATILWQAQQISNHLDQIALLQQQVLHLTHQLSEARKQMESQKDEWLSWEAKRSAIERDAAPYRESFGNYD
jgi:flagellar biosynthesis chaperone FliJ